MDVRGADQYSFQNPENFRVRTWKQQQPEAYQGIAVQNTAMQFIFFVLAVVFMLLIFAIMLVLVREKTRDIGILRAIGGTKGGIIRIFMLNGVAIGVTAYCVGLLFARLTLTSVVLNLFENTVQSFTGFKISEALFMMDHLPYIISVSNLVGAFGFVFVMTALSSVFPARMAAKIDPLETIRHEI